MFHINNLDNDSIWEIGLTYVAIPRSKPLYGRGDILEVAVETQKLKIDYNNSPPRHATIVGWPDEKDAQRVVALQLAAEATLEMNPSP